MSLASPASLYLSFNYVNIGTITWITWKSEAIKSWEEFRRNWQLCWTGLPSTPVAVPRQWVSHSKLPVCSLLQIRTATRTQRDGAHWGKGSWRNGGCPNQTAPLFPLLLYSFPHSPLPETSGVFQISLGSPFLPPKLGYRSRRKQETVSAAAILGYLSESLLLSAISTFVDSQFRCRL